MLLALWSVLLFVMLFLLGSAVGSFLNVCIIRLPQGRSLIRPASSCGQCGKPIRMRDNIPLLSYWLLRGRCSACGSAFSMRYFWIELLTGIIFVLIYCLEIGRNIHHYQLLSWYENDFEHLLMEIFQPRPWVVFTVHALLSCFLIVASLCNYEHHTVPRTVTIGGVLVGLFAATFFPWPWPDETSLAVATPSGSRIIYGRVIQPYAWGPHVGPMPAAAPWWTGDVTPRAGLYSWPVWGPLPDWLPPGSRRLGLATGMVGISTGAVLMIMVRLAFNWGAGAAIIGWGESSLLTIAGGFLGWQPIIVAGLLGLMPGSLAVLRQWFVERRKPIVFSGWLAMAVFVVWLGWYWIGPLVQGLFFNEKRLLLLAACYTAVLLILASSLRILAGTRANGR